MTRPLISIVTPCYNEELNVLPLYERIVQVMVRIPDIDYEHIFIDNCSRDKTPQLLRELAGRDKRVKVIFNNRNFGHIRSPYYGLLQARGDAAILMASDLQDPPEMIPEFIRAWREGNRFVAAVKKSSREFFGMWLLRKVYYGLIGRISDVKLVPQFTGFGLYDAQVIRALRQIDDPYPYFRGLLAELGFVPHCIPFEQPARVRGITSQNFYSLYDMAMLGISSHSKVPLRLATMVGFLGAIISLLIAFGYLFLKLIWWDNFQVGMAPLVSGFFFFASLQLIFAGLMGEYIGFIYTQVLKRPLVVERERLNFDDERV